MNIKLTTIENHEDHGVLTTPTQIVTFPLNKLATDCIQQLNIKFAELNGVGLAAPQINHPLRIFIIGISKGAAEMREHASPYPPTIYINPQYESIGNEKQTDFEGCFSVASKAGWVPRFQKIRFTALDESGQPIEFIASDFLARVLQHETDHLEGTLIIDRLTEGCIQGPVDEMLKMRLLKLPADKARKAWGLLSESKKTAIQRLLSTEEQKHFH